MTVHEFPQKERLLWICGCGCQTHYAYEDGSIECASCGDKPPPGTGTWRPKPEDADNAVVDRDENGPMRFDARVGIDREFSQRRFTDRVISGEFIAAIGIRENGGVSTIHSEQFTTSRQKRWLLRRLVEALAMLID